MRVSRVNIIVSAAIANDITAHTSAFPMYTVMLKESDAKTARPLHVEAMPCPIFCIMERVAKPAL